MKVELDFKLTRPAKKSGGDRYEHGVKGLKDHMVIYVPQFYSRLDGVPLSILHITIADFSSIEE